MTIESKFVTVKGKTAGKNPRAIEYQVIGRFGPQPTNADGTPKKDRDGNQVEPELITKGVVTDIDDVVRGLYKGDMQAMIDSVVTQYNRQQYWAASDPLSEYLNPHWNDSQKDAFKGIVNNAVKAGATTDAAVEMALSLPMFK